MFKPRKTTYAKVTYADIAGLAKGVGEGGLSGPLLNTLSQSDALLHVVPRSRTRTCRTSKAAWIHAAMTSSTAN